MKPQVVAEHLKAAEKAPHSQAKGRAYEDLVCYLFGQVPGCLVERDLTSVFDTEQIDIAVGNLRVPEGLGLLPPIFLVECKNWDQPADSQTVGYFFNILASRSVELGILVAANGVTGDLINGRHSQALGIGAAPRGIKMIVVTSDDLRRLEGIADFVQLLHRRYLRAYATGQLGAPTRGDWPADAGSSTIDELA
ncbi:hypothetical protein HDA40_001927 [Hamadaea flava]|uniref:Restriction endonuclease type IV Mrr domain-containing protein n=1 Tax=Hamadaea flava TaxID=1742688 RepID=A0ABV8LE81_9ACTN|nr:hypothetical protein [Hamadaea flava]MCP2323420.1 hypothetical protein [Hamadaea flava]